MNQLDPSPPNSNITATCTVTPADELCTAMLTFQHYHARVVLENEEAQALQEARNIINSVDANVLSTRFRLNENLKYRDEISWRNKSEFKINFPKNWTRSFDEYPDSLELMPIHLASFLGNIHVVNLFLERHPEGSSSVDSCDRIPLLHAILGGCVDVVKLLVKVYPEGLSRQINYRASNMPYMYGRRQRSYQQLPLHYAADFDNLAVLQEIFVAYDEAIKEKDSCGNLCLHRAAKAGHINNVRYLHIRYVEGIEVKGYDGKLPFHCVLKSSGDIETIMYLFQFYRDAVSIRDDLNNLPIHYAGDCGNNLLPLVKCMHMINPGGVKVKGENGWIPLHRAIQSRFPDVAKYLLDQYPDGAFVKDRYGKTPIYHAIIFVTIVDKLDMVKVLFDKHPEVLQQPCTSDGAIPLHIAASHVITEKDDILKFLLMEYPPGTSSKDDGGNTPMHYSAYNSTRLEFTEHLIDACPMVVLMKNNFGNLPIQDAIEKGHLKTVKVFLEKCVISNLIGDEFLAELFRHPEGEEDDDGDEANCQPMWEQRGSIWTTLIDRFGFDVLEGLQVSVYHPIILSAIGKISFSEMRSLMRTVAYTAEDELNLPGFTNRQGQTCLDIVIKEASKEESYWDSYFKRLLMMFNAYYTCRSVHEGDILLVAKNNGATRNILHHAALNGLPWYGLKDICEANVDILTIPIEESGLYPFMLPELLSRYNSSQKDNLTYKMLRMKPDVIKIISNEYGNGDTNNNDKGSHRNQKRRRLK